VTGDPDQLKQKYLKKKQRVRQIEEKKHEQIDRMVRNDLIALQN